ncbi:hypothetical protein MRX96_043469 [Rhipicephalus microplus]
MVMPTPLFVQAVLIWTNSALPICFADIQLSEEYHPFKSLCRLPEILAARKNAKFSVLPMWNEHSSGYLVLQSTRDLRHSYLSRDCTDATWGTSVHQIGSCQHRSLCRSTLALAIG